MIFASAQGRPDELLDLALLLLPDANLLSLAATVDPLRAANNYAERELYRWKLYSLNGERVTLTSGIDVETSPLPRSLPGQALIVVSGFNLERYVSPELIRHLRQLAPGLAGLGAVESGGILLARAGLLNGQSATTHWEDLDDMAERFPKIKVVRDRFVLSNKLFTTGGASPCIDMMLHLISSRQGRALAERVAGAFIYDPIHSGSDPQSLVSLARLQQRAPRVAEALRLMETHIEDPLPVSQIAAVVGMSSRRLEMLFRKELGESPAACFRRMRLEQARRMVVDTQRPLQEIAVRSGFNSQAAFSRAFVAAFGLAPSRIRKTI